MKKVYHFLNRIIKKIQKESRPSYPNIAPTARVEPSVRVVSPEHLYMGENSNIDAGAVIMNGATGKFIMKKNSGAAVGLTVLCGNHMSVVGLHFKQVTDEVKKRIDINHKYSSDVVVKEEVWIGANVTLCQGVVIGRGCQVGAGSVVRKDVPPYCQVVGNPARIIGFRFTPEEIIEHEKVLYEESERLPLEVLEKNYQKYFINRVGDIKNYLKL